MSCIRQSQHVVNTLKIKGTIRVQIADFTTLAVKTAVIPQILGRTDPTNLNIPAAAQCKHPGKASARIR